MAHASSSPVVATVIGSTHVEAVQTPFPQPCAQVPQFDESDVMSAQTPLQHWGTGAEHVVPTSVEVPQAPLTHVAVWHGLGAGQSAGVLHEATQAPLPSQTWPPSSPHADPAGDGTAPQHPAVHAPTKHGGGAGGGMQSLGCPQGLAQVPPSWPPEAPPVPTCPPVPVPVVVAEEPPPVPVNEAPVDELIDRVPVEEVPPTLPLFWFGLTVLPHATAAIVSKSAAWGSLEGGRGGTFRLLCVGMRGSPHYSAPEGGTRVEPGPIAWGIAGRSAVIGREGARCRRYLAVLKINPASSMTLTLQ